MGIRGPRGPVFRKISVIGGQCCLGGLAMGNDSVLLTLSQDRDGYGKVIIYDSLKYIGNLLIVKNQLTSLKASLDQFPCSSSVKD